MAYAQYVRSCGKVSPLSAQGAKPTTDLLGRPYTGSGYVEFIPSLCISERYDTNVFYAPKTPGLQSEDFVTDVNPMLRINHNGDYATGYLDLGGFGETYLRNSDLNFFGTADTLYLNLDNSIKRLLPNASLIFTDYVRYTPTPPGFSNVVAGTAPGSPVNIQNVYAQGVLSYRSNNVTNSATAVASYNITPLTSINASYSNMIIRFGSSPVTSTVVLFNTTSHTGTVGAKTQISALDTLSVTYSHTESEFTPHTTASSISSGSFVTNSALVGWSRAITPYLTATAGAGGILIDPGITTYALNAAMTINTPIHSATISYNRSAYPSFVGVGVPIVSDVFSLSAVQKLSLNWELDEAANYTHATGGSGQTSVTYDSYYAAVDLYYWISRYWSTGLTFDYTNYSSEFGAAKTNFDRYAVTLSVKGTWN